MTVSFQCMAKSTTNKNNNKKKKKNVKKKKRQEEGAADTLRAWPGNWPTSMPPYSLDGSNHRAHHLGKFRRGSKVPFLSGRMSKNMWPPLIHFNPLPPLIHFNPLPSPLLKAKLRCCLLQKVSPNSPLGPGAYCPLSSSRPIFLLRVSSFCFISL